MHNRVLCSIVFLLCLGTCIYLHIQSNLYHPTQCGQQPCWIIKKLLVWSTMMPVCQNMVRLENMSDPIEVLDYRGSTVLYVSACSLIHNSACIRCVSVCIQYIVCSICVIYYIGSIMIACVPNYYIVKPL